jgi:hypothetical protein
VVSTGILSVSKLASLQQSWNFDGLKKLVISSIPVLGVELHVSAIY